MQDYGCLHFKTPIICGISEPRHSPEELAELNKRNARTYEIDGKKMTGYEATQAMRRLEAAIRDQKSIRDTARASGDILQVRKSAARIKAYQAKYDEISNITGIAKEPKRMSVPKMPKIQEKSLTSSTNGGIIREGSTKPITKITDSAINSVTKVNVDGFTDEQNEFVQRQHQELLKYSRDNNDSKEVAFVFRKDLTDRSVFVGSDDKIEIGLDGKGDEIFLMHNHPRNSGYSNTDIATFIHNDNIKHLSIVKNNGEVEIISKLDNFSKEKMIIEFKRQYKKYVKTGADFEIDKAINKLLEKSKGELLWIKSK